MSKITVTLSFDDFHPQAYPYDFGGVVKSYLMGSMHLQAGGVLDKLLVLRILFGVKITLFTVPNWQDVPHSFPMRVTRRLGFRHKINEEKFRLDKHMDWVERVNQYVKDGTFEIAHHGCTHFNEKRGLHQQEFVNATYGEAESKLVHAQDIFDMVGMDTVRIFRPPGFGFNQDTLDALFDFGYRAISPFPSWHRISGNCTMNRMRIVPGGTSVSDLSNIPQTTTAIHLKGHLESRYGCERIGDGISDDAVFSNLCVFLKKLKKENDVEFKFVSEVVGA